MADYTQILRFTDTEQRMKIAREYGVTTRQQVYNILRGKSKNFSLLQRLLHQAEENKQLQERALELQKQLV